MSGVGDEAHRRCFDAQSWVGLARQATKTVLTGLSDPQGSAWHRGYRRHRHHLPFCEMDLFMAPCADSQCARLFGAASSLLSHQLHLPHPPAHACKSSIKRPFLPTTVFRGPVCPLLASTAHCSQVSQPASLFAPVSYELGPLSA